MSWRLRSPPSRGNAPRRRPRARRPPDRHHFAAPPGVVEEAAINLVRDGHQLDRHDQAPRRASQDRGGRRAPVRALLRGLDDRLRRPGPPGRKADRGEIGIPVFLYGAAASIEQNVSLAKVRRGGYEGFQAAPTVPTSARPHSTAEAAPLPSAPAPADRIQRQSRPPDGLVASTIAAALRTSGPIAQAGGRDTRLPHVQAMGWVLEPQGVAQVSCNLVDWRTTPPHVVFDACTRMAESAGSTYAAARSSGWSRLGPCSAPATMRSALEMGTAPMVSGSPPL